MSGQLFVTADWLDDKKNHGYGSAPIPQQRDHKILGLLHAWLALDAADRLAEVKTLPPGQRFVLTAFGERMASLAVRENDPSYIKFGLLSVGLCLHANSDPRDVLALLSLHYDAARRLTADADKQFEDAAQVLLGNVAGTLKSFIHRSEDDKLPEAMGYRAGRDADGFRYVRNS